VVVIVVVVEIIISCEHHAPSVLVQGNEPSMPWVGDGMDLMVMRKFPVNLAGIEARPRCYFLERPIALPSGK
jgi:hypothetical protein